MKGIKQLSEVQFLPLLLLCIIIIYGVFSRFTVIEHTVVVGHPIRADAKDYFIYAKNISLYAIFSRDQIASDGLLKDALRPPGFSYFASFFYQGDNLQSVNNLLWAQTIVQCMVFVLLAVICWVAFGAWFALGTSLLLWTHPSFMSINTYYLTESLFLSSLVLVVAAFFLAIKNTFHWATLFSLGISIGISALIRPTMEYYFLFLFVLICINQRHLAQKLWPAFIWFLVIIFSWKLRNYNAFGGFSDPILMINGLFHGSYPGFMYNNIPASYGSPYSFDPLSKEYYEGIGKTMSLIWQRAYEQPFKYFVWYLCGKQQFLWQWDIVAGQGDVFIYPVKSSPIRYQGDLVFWHHIHKFLNAPIMIIGVLYSYYLLIKGLIKNIQFDLSYVIASLVVYASLFHQIVAPYPRYGIPFKVLVMVIGILCIKNNFNKFIERRSK